MINTRRGMTFVAAALCALVGSAARVAAGPDGPSATAGAGPVPGVGAAPALSDQDKEPEVLVVLKDGRRITGLLVGRDDDGLSVRVSAIVTRFRTSEVESYQVLPPIFERYMQLRKAVGDDPEQILRLAEWLQNRERYLLALSEVQRALSIDPANPPAKTLKNILEQQIILQKRGAAGIEERRKEGTDARPVPRQGDDVPLLSHEQVNLIKVFETDLKDGPRLLIPREVVEQMLEKNLGHPLVPVTKEGREALLRRTPAEILDLMFRLHAREFYPRVQVLDPPRAMTAFRDQVQRTWLVNACATSQCHGGMEAGRLVLATRSPGRDPVVYTNMLILDRFRTRAGKPLIDWEKPERSLLLHLGLPRRDSLVPHPEVPRGENGHDAWKPVFKSTADKQFQDAVAWIKAMYRPRPDYPIDYRPVRPFEVPQTAQDSAPSPGTSAPAPEGTPKGQPEPPQPR